MDGHNKKPGLARRFRAVALGGTAMALVLGGAILGGSMEFKAVTPAYAEAVQVQGVQPISFADVVEKVKPAVVSVRVKSLREDASARMDDAPFFDLPEGSPMERFFRQFREQMPRGGERREARPATSLGSGFFISEDGFVVTNNHVVDKEQSVTIVMEDGTELPAKVVGKDDRTDLALLKVDSPDRTFTYVKFADAQPRVGEWVVAVGNPFGLGGTVTAGIISAHGRQIGAGPYDDFIQIDAAVNRGNSGGPAFNLKGEVVGVNTAIFSPSGGNVGIAFAIPSETASSVIGQLQSGGEVVRGWIGVQIQGIDKAIADGLGLSQEGGALVADVVAGAPAEKAGFRVGDAILSVNGEPVKDSRDLSLRISRLQPGETVKVVIWRDGKQQNFDVTLGTLPATDQLASANSSPDTEAPAAKTSSLEEFGLSVGPSEDGNGAVVITTIDPNGQAAERGLRRGDTILWVDNAPVTSASEVEAKIAEAKASGKEAVLLRIKSGERPTFVPLTFARS